MVWDKVEDFVDSRTGCPAETKAEGFGPNQLGRMIQIDRPML